ASVGKWARFLRDDVEPKVSEQVGQIVNDLNNATGGNASYSVRTKNADGLFDKVGRMTTGKAGRGVRPDYQVGDVIDAVGARITVDSTAELASTLDRVKSHFGTGENGRILEIENMYASPKSGAPNYRVVTMVIREGNATFELQLSTRRASIAADLQHNTA